MPNETTGKKLRRTLLVYTAIATILTGIIISVLTVTTLYKQLKLDQIKDLLHAENSTVLIAEQYIKRIQDVSRQVSSRTQAHILLEEYEAKKINYEAMNVFLKKILTAALHSTENLTGITRIDLQQKIMAEVGSPIKPSYWPNLQSKKITMEGPFKENGKYYLTIATPVYSSDKQRIGTDVALFNISNLKQIIKAHGVLSENFNLALGYREGNSVTMISRKKLANELPLRESLNKAINLQETGIVKANSGNKSILITYAPVPNSHWGVATIVKSRNLFAKIRHQIILLLLATLLLVVIMTLIAILVLKPLTGKILLHTSDLEKRIEEKTEELKKANTTLKYLARVDPLTQLINKREFDRALKVELNKAQRHNGNFAILFVDLDDFKAINDEYGHNAGDRLLEQIAARMMKTLRTEDTIARIGGDEFAILLTDPKNESNVEEVAKKLLNAIKEPYQVEDTLLAITLSIGIAMYPKDAGDTSELIACADTAMYTAKSRGKNALAFFSKKYD